MTMTQDDARRATRAIGAGVLRDLERLLRALVDADFLPGVVATRDDLKALSPTESSTVSLREEGRSGSFIWREGNYSTEIADDVQEAVFIKADGISASAGAWVRNDDWRGRGLLLDWFGAVGNGTTDDTVALQAAVNLASDLSVGSVYASTGTFLVSTTIAIPADVRLVGDVQTIIKQGNGENLSSIVSPGDRAELIGLIVDGNRANNTNDANVTAIHIGTSDDCVVERCTVRNSPGYGILINTGIRARIERNTLENCYMHCIAVYPTAGASTFHRIEGNYATDIGLSFLISGGSHDIIRNNTINGHLIGGPDARLTVNMSGTTVTWVSGPDFSDAVVGNVLVFDGGQEFLVTQVTSALSLQVSSTLPTETGMQAAIGPGDLVAIVGGSHNLIDGNTLIGGATFGMGVSQGGNSVDAAHNIFSNNNIFGCGKCAVVVTWDSGTGALRNNSFIGNKVKDCGQSPGGSTLDRTAIVVSGNGQTDKIFDTFISGNTISSLSSGSGQAQYWLGTDGYGGAGEIKVGRNLPRGVANASAIFQDVTGIELTGWGDTASTDSIVSYGHSVRFRIVSAGTGQTSYPSFAVSKLVDVPSVPPMIFGEVTTAAGATVALNTIFGSQNSAQGTWLSVYNGVAVTAGDLTIITLKA